MESSLHGLNFTFDMVEGRISELKRDQIIQYEEQWEKRLKHFQKPVGHCKQSPKIRECGTGKISDEWWLKISQTW